MNVYELQFKKFWMKKFIVFFISCSIITSVWWGGIHTYISSRIGEEYGEIYSILIAVVFITGLLIKLKLWRAFIDRSFQGVIIKINHKETLASPKWDSRPTATEERFHIYLSVLLQNGNTITKHIEHNEPFYDHLWYRVGDYITYHRGTKFPLVSGGRKICAYCGHEYMKNSNLCSNCGFTSIYSKTNNGKNN